jgi:hypothetical protein
MMALLDLSQISDVGNQALRSLGDGWSEGLRAKVATLAMASGTQYAYVAPSLAAVKSVPKEWTAPCRAAVIGASLVSPRDLNGINLSFRTALGQLGDGWNAREQALIAAAAVAGRREVYDIHNVIAKVQSTAVGSWDHESQAKVISAALLGNRETWSIDSAINSGLSMRPGPWTVPEQADMAAGAAGGWNGLDAANTFWDIIQTPD